MKTCYANVQFSFCTEHVNVMSITQRLLDAGKDVCQQGIVKGVPGVILENFVTLPVLLQSLASTVFVLLLPELG